jgi:DnaJ-class molecular chaperone
MNSNKQKKSSNLSDCHMCNGKGKRLNWWSQVYNTCTKCNGTGKFDYED